MRTRWFSKIENRADALSVIRSASNTFFVLAGLQAAVSAYLIFALPTSPYSRISADTPFDMLFTAFLFAVPAFTLRISKGRTAAVILLLVALLSMVSMLTPQPGAVQGGKNLFFAAIAIWAGIRATQATFKLHGRFSESVPPRTKERPSKPYDIEKWEALLKYDSDIAMAAKALQPLGEKWIDEFARAYLILNDKRYIHGIVQTIIVEARKEGRTI